MDIGELRFGYVRVLSRGWRQDQSKVKNRGVDEVSGTDRGGFAGSFSGRFSVLRLPVDARRHKKDRQQRWQAFLSHSETERKALL